MDENEKFKEWLEKLSDTYKNIKALGDFDFLADSDEPDSDECFVSEMECFRLTPDLCGVTIVYTPGDITVHLDKLGIPYMFDREYSSQIYDQIIFDVGGVRFYCLRGKSYGRKRSNART